MKSFADFISEATPRGKNIQRPVGRQPKASYRDQMRAKQRQERLERQKSIDSSTQRGPTASKEAKKAEEKRKQNDPRTSRLRGTIADRMAQGAKEHGLDEERRETEIGITGQPVPNKKLGAKKRYEFEKKRRENLKKRPGDAPGESKLIQLMRDRAKKEGNIAESRTKEQQIKGQKAVLDAKIKSEYDRITKEIPRRK